jgi:aldehyde:ferredoxin oxidoreductase
MFKMFGPLDPEKWEKIKDDYYLRRGWDKKTGWPTRERLEKLGLSDVAGELRDLGRLPV